MLVSSQNKYLSFTLHQLQKLAILVTLIQSKTNLIWNQTSFPVRACLYLFSVFFLYYNPSRVPNPKCMGIFQISFYTFTPRMEPLFRSLLIYIFSQSGEFIEPFWSVITMSQMEILFSFSVCTKGYFQNHQLVRVEKKTRLLSSDLYFLLDLSPKLFNELVDFIFLQAYEKYSFSHDFQQEVGFKLLNLPLYIRRSYSFYGSIRSLKHLDRNFHQRRALSSCQLTASRLLLRRTVRNGSLLCFATCLVSLLTQLPGKLKCQGRFLVKLNIVKT